MAQTLGSVAVGTVVKINENGSPVNYLVVHQGLPSSMYDASCDGTWVLRQDIYENAVWDAGNSNVLPGADIFTTMAGMLSLYDPFIQSAIQTVKIPYCVGGGSFTIRAGVNGLQCQIFPLSGYEVGWTTSNNQNFPVDGAVLSYFQGTSLSDPKRIAYLNGVSSRWWTRSQLKVSDETNRIFDVASGSYGLLPANNSSGVRPAFVLPQTLIFSDDGTIGAPPSSITVPSIAMQTQPINISWSSVDGADSYVLQRKADSGEWTQVYAGALTIYTDTAGTWSTVQYQVCGVFDGTNGAFAQSDVITVVAASALVISGSDGDLGTITSDITYSINSDTGNQISLTRTVNGSLVASLTVDNGFAYNIPVMDLPTGTGTIVITATVQSSSGPVTVKRTWTYTKASVQFPGSGGVAALSQDGQPIFPQTLAEAVKAIGGPWGGNLSTALDKLALAAVYNRTKTPKYTEVKVDLSKVQAGDIVNLSENGVMVPFYVGSVDYEPTSHSGASRVLLVRKDVYQRGQWNSTNVNSYADSTIDTWLNSTYKNMLDSTVKGKIGVTAFQYTPGNGNNQVSTLTRSVFVLSLTELGFSDANANIEGNELPISDLLKTVYYDESVYYQLTRSPVTNTTNKVWRVNNIQEADTPQCSDSNGVRPCFTLPTTFQATYYVDTAGTVHPSQEYTTAGDFADLWGNIIPIVKIETGSYVGTGTYGSGNPNTLTFSFEPKVVIVYQNFSDANGPFNGAGIFLFSDTSKTQYVDAGYFLIQNNVASSVGHNVKISDSTIYWYSNSAQNQLNQSGNYNYIAIG